MTSSIDQTLHQFANFLPNWTLLPILTLLPNFRSFHRTLQRVWLANRGLLRLQTPGPVPFWDLHLFLCWDHFHLNCHIFGLWISNILWYFFFFFFFLYFFWRITRVDYYLSKVYACIKRRHSLKLPLSGISLDTSIVCTCTEVDNHIYLFHYLDSHGSLV